MSINRVMISGKLTRDPELRSTTNGQAILTFGVAVNDRRRNQATGEWEDYPNYVNCVMFGNRASSLQRYLTKGTKVAVEGKLRYSSWEKDGAKRSKLEVIVDELEFMSSRNQRQNDAPYNAPAYNAPQPAPQPNYGQRPAPQYGAQQPAPVQVPYGAPAPAPQVSNAPAQQTPPPTDVYDEDIPF